VLLGGTRSRPNIPGGTSSETFFSARTPPGQVLETPSIRSMVRAIILDRGASGKTDID